MANETATQPAGAREAGAATAVAEPGAAAEAATPAGARDAAARQGVTVRPVVFTPLEGTPAGAREAGARAPGDNAAASLDMLLDIQVAIIVELGHTEMCIEDLLALKPGSVIELDKLASEPVDLLIRGHVVAHGEVIVVDDNFGIRITQIADPADRVKDLR